MTSARTKGPTRTALVLAALVAVAGCATTRQTRSAEPSGFLGDYSILEPGGDGQAQLRYVKDMDFSVYHSMILESVTLWHEGSPKVTPEEQQALTDYAYVAFHDAFRRSFRMVREPGEGVIRAKIALTEVTGARVLANAITTVLPQLRTLSRLGALATDQSFAAGRASLELEILDSLTGERLGAWVDERMGAKALRHAFSRWADVEAAIDFWAATSAARVEKRRRY